MHRIAMIGYGAVAGYVARMARKEGFELAAIIARESGELRARERMGDLQVVTRAADLSADLDLVVECAGPAGPWRDDPARGSAGDVRFSRRAGRCVAHG